MSKKIKLHYLNLGFDMLLVTGIGLKEVTEGFLF